MAIAKLVVQAVLAGNISHRVHHAYLEALRAVQLAEKTSLYSFRCSHLLGDLSEYRMQNQ